MALAFAQHAPVLHTPISKPFGIIPIIHSTTCSQQPPQPSTQSLRDAYKSAKAAYKSAKRAHIITDPQNLSNLEATYREAKARYKHSKYPPTPIYPTTTPTTPTNPTTPTTPTTSTNQQNSTNVVVCGGPSCKRLGSDAVAAMLRVPPPTAKCMKRCGGVGPTVAIDSVPVKINFRKALGEALRTAAQDYAASN